MRVEKGAQLGHYEILSVLGKGGMGEVYLAQDARLDRRVALKILPDDLASDADRLARFVREAKAASALNHPNIITVYDIGETAGTHFIAYEFIDGTTLREYAKSPAFNLASALDVAIQVAAALVEAHGAGIVHRDLKPDNVMIRATGLVKLLDFGIARLSPAATDSADTIAGADGRTQLGMLLGTPQFMSPEQARGSEVDHQTDLFSFGVVLYELLSGRSPFAAATVTDTIVAVLTYEPAPLVGVPRALADVVTKALQKDKARRYQSATALLDDLRRVEQDVSSRHRVDAISDSGVDTIPTTVSQATDARPGTSVAVLPFSNMSADEDNEHFCDGLAEELRDALAKINALRVAARTSSFSFKGKNADVATIATALGVNRILEGSIRKSGQRLRISVQLIDAANGYQLWSERYDREMRDVFALQDEITLAVVEALKVTLFGTEKATLLERSLVSAEAYELFLKGRYHSYKYTAQGWMRSIEFFEKAIAIQPDYALAYAGLSASHACLWFFGMLPAAATIPQWEAASSRALALDLTLADAHMSVGLIAFFYEWNWDKADHELTHCIALDPKNAEALSYYAMFLAFLGRIDEALRVVRQALALDPLAPLINMNGGWTYFSAGMIDEAAAQASRMTEIDPAFSGAYWLRGAIHLSKGEFGRAVEQLRIAVSLGAHQIVVADLASACSLAGQDDEAALLLRQLVDRRREHYVPAICLARIYSRLGDTARAIEWLETAFAERNGEMVFLREEIAGAAEDDPLRRLGNEPRVLAMLDRMNLP